MYHTYKHICIAPYPSHGDQNPGTPSLEIYASISIAGYFRLFHLIP